MHARKVSHLYPNGTEMNGTLIYQLHDPRTAAEFAPTWDNVSTQPCSHAAMQRCTCIGV